MVVLGCNLSTDKEFDGSGKQILHSEALHLLLYLVWEELWTVLVGSEWHLSSLEDFAEKTPSSSLSAVICSLNTLVRILSMMQIQKLLRILVYKPHFWSFLRKHNHGRCFVVKVTCNLYFKLQWTVADEVSSPFQRPLSSASSCPC